MNNLMHQILFIVCLSNYVSLQGVFSDNCNHMFVQSAKVSTSYVLEELKNRAGANASVAIHHIGNVDKCNQLMIIRGSEEIYGLFDLESLSECVVARKIQPVCRLFPIISISTGTYFADQFIQSTINSLYKTPVLARFCDKIEHYIVRKIKREVRHYEDGIILLKNIAHDIKMQRGSYYHCCYLSEEDTLSVETYISQELKTQHSNLNSNINQLFNKLVEHLTTYKDSGIDVQIQENLIIGMNYMCNCAEYLHKNNILYIDGKHSEIVMRKYNHMTSISKMLCKYCDDLAQILYLKKEHYGSALCFRVLLRIEKIRKYIESGFAGDDIVALELQELEKKCKLIIYEHIFYLSSVYCTKQIISKNQSKTYNAFDLNNVLDKMLRDGVMSVIAGSELRKYSKSSLQNFRPTMEAIIHEKFSLAIQNLRNATTITSK